MDTFDTTYQLSSFFRDEMEALLNTHLHTITAILLILLALCVALVLMYIALWQTLGRWKREQSAQLQQIHRYLRAHHAHTQDDAEDVLADLDYLADLLEQSSAPAAVAPWPAEEETPSKQTIPAPVLSMGITNATHLADTINRLITEKTEQDWRRHILRLHPQYASCLLPVEPQKSHSEGQSVLQLFDDSQEKKLFAFIQDDILYVFPNSGNISDFALKPHTIYDGYNSITGINRVTRPALAKKNDDDQWVLVEKGRLQ